MRVEGTVWNTLKEGATDKRGGEAKILKKKGQARSGMDALKGGDGTSGTPLRNYDVYIYIAAGK